MTIGRSRGEEAKASSRIADAEAWWAFVARILSFLLGAGILGWQTLFERQDRVYLIVAGIGLMGPTVAQSVATVFASIRGGPGGDHE